MSTAIEWTEETWNPTTGCDRVSPGCDHCYALTLAKRLKAMGQPRYQNDGDPRTSGPGFKLTMHGSSTSLDLPMRWKRGRRIFVNSMSDLFHPDVSENFIAAVWQTMNIANQHTYQILTKRPQRMESVVGRMWRDCNGDMVLNKICEVDDPAPLPHVWLGTSIEDGRYRFRIDHLRNTPASIRFLSIEPLLASIKYLDLDGIDWVIVGGESGANARPMDIGWVRDIRDQCTDLKVPFLFKQWGGRTPKAGGRELDGRTWDEYPT